MDSLESTRRLSITTVALCVLAAVCEGIDRLRQGFLILYLLLNWLPTAAVAMGRIGSIGPSLGGVLRAQGHSPAQLRMDLAPLAVVGGIAAIVLAYNRVRVAGVPAE